MIAGVMGGMNMDVRRRVRIGCGLDVDWMWIWWLKMGAQACKTLFLV